MDEFLFCLGIGCHCIAQADLKCGIPCPGYSKAGITGTRHHTHCGSLVWEKWEWGSSLSFASCWLFNDLGLHWALCAPVFTMIFSQWWCRASYKVGDPTNFFCPTSPALPSTQGPTKCQSFASVRKLKEETVLCLQPKPATLAKAHGNTHEVANCA